MTVDTDEGTARRLTRLERFRLWARRVSLGRTALIALVALVLGVFVGRLMAPSGHEDARRMLENTIVPLVQDADTLWTGTTEDGSAVAEALIALRRDGDPEPVLTYREEWIRAYDSALVQMTGIELPPDARPVQRQFVASVTLSRDAIDVLVHAANSDEPEVRRALTSEVVRLRQRAEHLNQVARSALRDLEGPGGSVTRLPTLPSFDELR